MGSAKKREPIAVEKYLAGELVSRIKHEYLGGVVYAMVGVRNVHNVIATNAVVALGSRLRGKKAGRLIPTRKFASACRLRRGLIYRCVRGLSAESA